MPISLYQIKIIMEVIRNSAFLQSLLGDKLYKVTTPSIRYPLVVLFAHPSAALMPSQDEAFLEKILQAVNLNFDEVKLINLLACSPEDDWSEWVEIPAHYLIAFGTEIPLVSANIPLYALQHHQAVSFFKAHSLEEIANDQEKKRLLWAALKQMFL